MTHTGTAAVQEKVTGVQALHEKKSAQLNAAQTSLRSKIDRCGTESTGIDALRSRLSGVAGYSPAFQGVFMEFNRSVEGENEAGLKASMEKITQKMLAIMAIIIREMEADMSAMTDLLDIIGELDQEFFMYAQQGIRNGTFTVSEDMLLLLALAGQRVQAH